MAIGYRITKYSFLKMPDKENHDITHADASASNEQNDKGMKIFFVALIVLAAGLFYGMLRRDAYIRESCRFTGIVNNNDQAEQRNKNLDALNTLKRNKNQSQYSSKSTTRYKYKCNDGQIVWSTLIPPKSK